MGAVSQYTILVCTLPLITCRCRTHSPLSALSLSFYALCGHNSVCMGSKFLTKFICSRNVLITYKFMFVGCRFMFVMYGNFMKAKKTNQRNAHKHMKCGATASQPTKQSTFNRNINLDEKPDTEHIIMFLRPNTFTRDSIKCEKINLSIRFCAWIHFFTLLFHCCRLILSLHSYCRYSHSLVRVS